MNSHTLLAIKLKIRILFVILVIFLTLSRAQHNQVLPSEEIITQQIFTDRVLKSQEKETSNLGKYTKKQAALIREQIQYRTTLLNTMLGSGELIFNSPIQKYVELVFDRIISSNPEVGKGHYIYVSRSAAPNAYNVGGGFVIVNTGLLERMNSEAELAFVLCHELSHQVLDHVNTNIEAYAIEMTDKARKEEIKKILQSKYKVYTQLENLILPGLTQQMAFSRTKELQADSLGFSFFVDAGYPHRGADNLMLLLDRIDEDENTELIDFQSLFSFDSLTFNAEWLRYRSTSSLGVSPKPADAEPEALRTHPDAKLRLQILRRSYSVENATLLNDPDYTGIRMLSMAETIEGLFLNGHYSKAIYQAIRMIEADPEQLYPRHIISIILARLNKLKKERRAGIFLDVHGLTNSEAYNRNIAFLWEIDSKDCAEISYWWTRKTPVDVENRYSVEAYLYSAMAMQRKKEFRSLYSIYKRNFGTTAAHEEFASYLQED